MKTAEICNKTVLIVQRDDLVYDAVKKGIRYPFSPLHHLKSADAVIDHNRADVVLFINGDQVSVLKDRDHSAPEILNKKNYTKLLLKAGVEN